LRRSLSIVTLFLALSAPLAAQDAQPPDTRFQDGGLWLPEAASDYSGRVDGLYRAIFWLTLGMFVLTEGLLIAFCVIYRRRPGHRPQYTHGNHTAELVWTIIPALMLLGLAFWQIPTWNYIKRDGFPKAGSPGVTTIDVIGEQFKWHVRYPGTKSLVKDKEKDAPADVNLTGIMRVPFGDRVLLNLRSKDVIHSFFIPLMRVKQDTVPGLRQRAWFKPNRMKLVEIQGEPKPDPMGYKRIDNKIRQLQPVVWITDEKVFEDPNSEYFKAPIALSNYAEVDGWYDVLKVRSTGQAKPVRILEKGKVRTGNWSECKYAIGIVEVACAELCGQGHYTMRTTMYVEPRASFLDWQKAWLQERIDGDAEDIPAFKFWID
jgi:cytochrome c oxidase subunit II